MSLFTPMAVTCGGCGGTCEVERAASINADRRDDLRLAILDCSFQAETCPDCGASMRLPAQLNYLDVGRGQWVFAEDNEAFSRWHEIETTTRALFDDTYGVAAPAMAREIGAGLAPRLVFGWPALREKLHCAALGLDDVTLELLKFAAICHAPGSVLADDTELRLVDATDKTLDLAWMRPQTEQCLSGLTIGRDVYDDIAADSAAWSDLRSELTVGLFVDIRRMFAG